MLAAVKGFSADVKQRVLARDGDALSSWGPNERRHAVEKAKRKRPYLAADTGARTVARDVEALGSTACANTAGRVQEIEETYQQLKGVASWDEKLLRSRTALQVSARDMDNTEMNSALSACQINEDVVDIRITIEAALARAREQDQLQQDVRAAKEVKQQEWRDSISQAVNAAREAEMTKMSSLQDALWSTNAAMDLEIAAFSATTQSKSGYGGAF